MHCALYLGAVAILAGFGVGYLVARAPGARAGRRILAAAHARAEALEVGALRLARDAVYMWREIAAARRATSTRRQP